MDPDDPRGEPGGALAFGLACGAHMAVNQGISWSARSGREWRDVLDGLLAERGENPPDIAMELRWQATIVRTVPPDLAGWHRLIHQAAEHGHGRVGGHAVPVLLAAAERISRYEERFRADGLVSPYGVVHSARGHDWGRAVNVARWGLRADYCDEADAEGAILRAGELCARHYMSWADLSAAFVLGRMLAIEDKEFPAHYPQVREAHRALLTEDGSPWRTVSWPALVPRG